MKIRRTILPGQPGAKRWKRKYGRNLICVRYRYDNKKNKKLTTVEIIVEEKVWERRINKIPLNKIMPIIVMYNEIDISKLVKNAGGRWNIKEKVWELPYGEILSLGLEDRIVIGRGDGK
ncbi:MAG: hypothetical protein P8Z35_13725 [Ignavibacteriaceae bacterium]